MNRTRSQLDWNLRTKKLQEEIVSLREEIARLEKDLDTATEDNIAVQVENERLRANALDWKKWPGEKPQIAGHCLCCDENDNWYKAIWLNETFYRGREIVRPTHFVEIVPLPKEGE